MYIHTYYEIGAHTTRLCSLSSSNQRACKSRRMWHERKGRLTWPDVEVSGPCPGILLSHSLNIKTKTTKKEATAKTQTTKTTTITQPFGCSQRSLLRVYMSFQQFDFSQIWLVLTEHRRARITLLGGKSWQLWRLQIQREIFETTPAGCTMFGQPLEVCLVIKHADQFFMTHRLPPEDPEDYYIRVMQFFGHLFLEEVGNEDFQRLRRTFCEHAQVRFVYFGALTQWFYAWLSRLILLSTMNFCQDFLQIISLSGMGSQPQSGPFWFIPSLTGPYELFLTPWLLSPGPAVDALGNGSLLDF